ncbi:VOC family protein [Actinomadura napierensis]|uniref:VOC domain-containing protein n=1 Tax=Actinomadura napierensis TaxID=267854 RepID=A0ABN3A4P5_9ACTN
MGLHHIAIATTRLRETHDFYTGAMGFTLVKIVRARASEGGWSKHAFYDTGGGEFFAVWDLHVDGVPGDFDPAISRGLGLPTWANHIAFRAEDEAGLDARLARILDHGYTAIEVDHGFCRSVYVHDPNKIMVEFCLDVRPFTEEERLAAERELFDDAVEPEPEIEGVVHRPKERAGAAR